MTNIKGSVFWARFLLSILIAALASVTFGYAIYASDTGQEKKIDPKYFFKLFHIWNNDVDFPISFISPPALAQIEAKMKNGQVLSGDEKELSLRFHNYNEVINRFNSLDLRNLREKAAAAFNDWLNNNEHFYITQGCQDKECLGFRLGLAFMPVVDQYTLKLECEVKFYLGDKRIPFAAWGKNNAVIYFANSSDPFTDALLDSIQLIDMETFARKLGDEKKFNRLFYLFHYTTELPRYASVEKIQDSLNRKKVKSEIIQKSDGSKTIVVNENAIFDLIRKKPRICFVVDKVSEGKGPFQFNFGPGTCHSFQKGECTSKDQYKIKASWDAKNCCYNVDTENDFVKVITTHEGAFDNFYETYKDQIQLVGEGKGGANE